MLSMLRKKMKAIMVGVAVVFAATMFYGIGYTGLKNMDAGSKKGSLATINGKEIDHERFQQALNRLFNQEKGRIKPEKAMLYQVMALQQTLDFSVMLNDAKKYNKAGNRELNDTIEQIMQTNKIPDKKTFEQALKNMGTTMSQFRTNIKEEILVAKMVNRIRSGITIGPDDLREVKASHILILSAGKDAGSDFEARAKSEELLLRVKKGESFSVLASKYSQDSGSAKNGGDLGYFGTGMMVPEFEKAAFSLKPGQISDVIKTAYGYHIIKVEDTRLRKISEKGKDMNEVVLAQKQDQAVKKWLAELYGKTKIEINDQMLQAHSMLLSGRVDDAIAEYNKSILANPYNGYSYLFLGSAYRQSKKNDLALAQYTRAYEMSGADVNLLMALADSFLEIGKKQLALDAYRKASLMAGDAKAIHVELKTLFTKLGASTDAAKEQGEIKRIEKKESFEKEIQQQIGK